MLKKLLFILLIFAFLIPNISFAITLEEEKELAIYIGETIRDYIRETDWTDGSYQDDADAIGKILERFGYTEQDSWIGILGNPQTGLIEEIVIIIPGRANPEIRSAIKMVFELHFVPTPAPQKKPNQNKRFGI